ncbi:MAG: hypothetical protein LBH20_00180 [Treponema sp.]|jgi:hypothetical protein|nr:hypothetical protein [Treponema sp.]
MKKLFITVLTLMCVVSAYSSGNGEAKGNALNVPENVKIEVEGRTMIVIWDAVDNVSGYEIVTYSEGCNSGKKKINTLKTTAVVFNPDNPVNDGADALNTKKDDGTPANGSVEIVSKTKIQITLMPATTDPTKPMATAVTTKVMSLGEKGYTNSGYSEVVTKTLGGGM